MYLENVVVDAAEPQQLGRFWEAALGTETLTDAPDIFETRLALGDSSYLDLCFPQVREPRTEHPRLHLDLAGGAEQEPVVTRLLGLGATHLDIGQGDVPWVVLADPEGNPFCVMEHRDEYVGTGPVAALPLDCADPERDRDFWRWLTGWVEAPGAGLPSLRHPAGVGPLLELCPQRQPKSSTKNRIHLDLRLEADDDPEEVAAGIRARGGSRLEVDWGELPWESWTDPSGNEFCVLPSR